MAIEYISDIRERRVVKPAGDNVSVAYEVKNQTGQPVNLINGTVSKDAVRIGVLNVDVTSNTAYISLENFTALDHAARKTALSAISDHLEAILTEPVEEPQA